MVVLLSVIYVIFPVDVIPDILVGVGQIDDLAVVASGGGSIASMTIFRHIMAAIFKRPKLRAGCIAITLIGSLVILAGGLLLFFAIYRLITTL